MKSVIHSDEIMMDDAMYDIESVRIKDGLVEMLVMRDYKEENLLKKIKSFVNKSKRSETEFPDQLQQILSLLYILPEQVFSLQMFSSEADTSFPFLSMPVFSKEQSNLTPPPKFSFL
jgi:hypothetical protein